MNRACGVETVSEEEHLPEEWRSSTLGKLNHGNDSKTVRALSRSSRNTEADSSFAPVITGRVSGDQRFRVLCPRRRTRFRYTSSPPKLSPLFMWPRLTRRRFEQRECT